MFSRDLLPLPEVNRAIALQLNGLSGTYDTGRGEHALVGRPVPEATIQTSYGLVRVADLLAGGEFLLLDLTGSGRFEDIDMRRLRVASGPASGSPPALEGVTAMIVRPDGYVHWASSESSVRADEVSIAMRDWLLAG